MKVRNLTPHPLVLQDAEGRTVELAPEGPPPRVSTVTKQVDQVDVDGVVVPLVHERTGEVVNLPEPQDGVLLVVSRVVAAAVPDRDDVVFPTEFVRDEQGRIVAASALGRF